VVVTGDVETERIRRELLGAIVTSLADANGGYLTWDQLANLPLPDGTTQRLVDPGKGGIWNPRDFVATLSIITSPDGPYPDREEDGLLEYHYQRGPEGGKNLKLRAAIELRLPLLRLNKVAKGIYAPVFPVYVVGDNPITRQFTLSLDENIRLIEGGVGLSVLEKAYAERMVQQRVHQPAFRARIMLAYDGACTVCTLKHPELLDAAHIIEDASEHGDPVVPNGLSLCKIHHAAYDRNLLGISPDYEVLVNVDLLHEVDGPMLKHGLQEMHQRRLQIPVKKADRPDPDRLQLRFERFESA
jgi:putative restriction endonuclease